MVQVEIDQGLLEGEVLEACSGDGSFYSFKGIPYGAPPVGASRFKSADPAPSWTGIRQAKQHGPSCPQKDLKTRKFQPGSEDCLSLNVYTPELKPANPLPVIIYVHGGGFKIGSGNVDRYGPDFLVTRGVILVTINYRFEILGFLCLDTKDVPGNAGLKDQVLAFKWVKHNISAFGGDPNNVTLAGESAGAACIALHLLSPMSKGLFRRAILQSATIFSEWTIGFEPRRRAFELGKKFGLHTDDPQVLLEFFQNTPLEKLIDTNPIVFAGEKNLNFFLKMFPFTPVVEKELGGDHFITENPVEILRKGNLNDVDIIVGNTSHEVVAGVNFLTAYILPVFAQYHEVFVPKDIYFECKLSKILQIADRIQDHYFGKELVSVKTVKEFIKCMNDYHFYVNLDRFATILSNSSKCKIYKYLFTANTKRNIHGRQGEAFGMLGPGHSDDVMHLFDPKKENLKMEKGSPEYKVSELLCTLFTNFAKYGTPTEGNWPEYNNDSKKYIEISEEVTVHQNLEADAIAFWKSIYDEAGLQFYC